MPLQERSARQVFFGDHGVALFRSSHLKRGALTTPITSVEKR